MSDTITERVEVSRLELIDAGILAPFYNRLVAGTPFCYPVSEGRFVEGVVAKSPDHISPERMRESSHHVASDRLREEHLLVARRAGEVLGFAHTALEHTDGADRGVIRFLGYTPGERAAGQELLSRAEGHLCALGVRETVAFEHDYPYPFYHLALGYLSDRLAHITGLLGVNGYAAVVWPPETGPSIVRVSRA